MARVKALPGRAPRETQRAREIQRVAAELFFASGYEATTTRQIAQALRVTSASLYYHYADKEQILFELIRSTMEQLTAGARTVLEQEAGPDRQLAGLVVHHVVLHALRPRETTLGETELRSLTGERRSRVLKMRDDYEGLVLGVLEEGARRGLFDARDLKLSAYAIIAQCTNVGIWYREDGRLGLDEIAATYADLALRIVGGGELERATLARLAAAAAEFHGAWR